MVALFAGLKWRLLISRWHALSSGRRFLVGSALSVAGLVAVVVSLVLGFLRSDPELARTVVTLLFAGQLVAWVLAPLIAFGVDETVDPHRFALLPMTRATLMNGLTTTALIGWLPALNVIVLIGAAVAVSPTMAVLPLGLLAALLQLAMCVLLSRAASTALVDLMSTRRGRDLGMLVGFGVMVAYIGLNGLLGHLRRDAASGLAGSFTSTSRVLGWSPPGAAARIPGLVADGRWGLAVLVTAVPVATLVLARWGWHVALRRSLESGVSITESSAPAAGRGFARSGGTARVVASRDRVLIWRDPLRRLPWLMVTVLTIGMPFIWVQGRGALFATAFGAVLAGTQAANQFGVDGSGLWLHLVAIGDGSRARAEVTGHLTATVIPGAVVLLVAVPVIGLVRGDLDLIPAGLGFSLSALVGAAGIACYMSALKPYAMPQARGSMFAQPIPQHKGRTAQVSIIVLLGGLAVALPSAVFAALAVLQNPAWGWIGLLVGPAVASLAAVILVGKAGATYFESGPEVLAAVRIGDRP